MECEITAYRPIEASTSATARENRKHFSQESHGKPGVLQAIFKSAHIVNGQIWIDVLDGPTERVG
jgi:hypothetical protein